MCATMIVTFTMTSQSRELVSSVQSKLLQPSAQLSMKINKLWWWLRPLPGRWSPLSSLKCRSLLPSRRGTMAQKGEALHHTGQNLGHYFDCNWQCWSESFDCDAGSQTISPSWEKEGCLPAETLPILATQHFSTTGTVEILVVVMINSSVIRWKNDFDLRSNSCQNLYLDPWPKSTCCCTISGIHSYCQQSASSSGISVPKL